MDAEIEQVKAETKATEQNNKPGVKTSEFWITLVVQLVAILVVALGAYKGSDGLTEFGGILMGLAGGTYTMSRGISKRTR